MCNFCNIDEEKYGEYATGVSRNKNFYIEDHVEFMKLCHDAYESSEKIVIQYCPMCGRKLNEEV